MITDHDIPMLPIFSEDAKSLLEGLLERNVLLNNVNFIAQEEIRSRFGGSGCFAFAARAFIPKSFASG